MTIDTARPRRLISDAICRIAPDIDPAQVAELDADDNIRDAFELDSMDQLNIAAEIFERCGVNIPERDYFHMETLGTFEDYLRVHLGDDAS